MRDFADLAKRLLHENGYSMSAAARAISYDLSYLSRVLNGKQIPSRQLAEVLDKLLGANGELRSLTVKAKIPVASDESRSLEGEIVHMKTGAMHLLEHADRYGGDTVAPAAVPVWRTAQQKLDTGSIPEEKHHTYTSAVAEAAEVAGWLLYDAGQWDTARSAFLESHILARHAGDRSMQWFALDMLAMLAVENTRPGEAMRIADEILSQRSVPPRVALMARVRRGRALALIGEHRRSATDFEMAKGMLEDSLSPGDPEWAGWIDSGEVAGHFGQALISFDNPGEAIAELNYALERATPRGTMYYRTELLRGYTAVKAWGEAEDALEAIALLCDNISSGRNRRILHGVLNLIIREARAPVWVSDLAREVRNKVVECRTGPHPLSDRT